jgi:chemotaxis protein CheC
LDLSQKHREALTELINIGYGRAAGSLSELTGQRITLTAPKVDLCSLERLKEELNKLLKGEVASVHQVFSGPISGHALLLVTREGAEALTSLLMGEQVAAASRAAQRESLVELGNIILQGSMGICGNTLHIHVTFSVPSLALESVDDLLHSVTIEDSELQFALLVQTRFELLKSQLSGYLVVVLGVTSFTKLLEGLDEWESRHHAESR